MATFKVFDPTTGQYVEKEVEGMTAAAEAVQEAAAPVVEAVKEAAAALECIITDGIDIAMNRFNTSKKHEEKHEEDVNHEDD